MFLTCILHTKRGVSEAIVHVAGSAKFLQAAYAKLLGAGVPAQPGFLNGMRPGVGECYSLLLVMAL